MFRSSYWAIIPMLVLGGILLWGVFIYEAGDKKEIKAEVLPTAIASTPVLSPTKVATLSSIPQASPSPQLVLSQFQIKVLNGSGRKGEAAKTKEILEGAGFSVSGIGNNDTSNYRTTLIQVTKEVSKEFITRLEEALSKELVLADKAELVSGVDTPVTIIVGRGKVQPNQ